MLEIKRATSLQQLIYGTEHVLVVLHAPSAAHARIMEAAGDPIDLDWYGGHLSW
jgi:hypothetical protein